MRQPTKTDYALNDCIKIYADCECEECEKAFKYTSLNFALKFLVDSRSGEAWAIFPIGRKNRKTACIPIGAPGKDLSKSVKSLIRKLQRKKVCVSEWYRHIGLEFEERETV